MKIEGEVKLPELDEQLAQLNLLILNLQSSLALVSSTSENGLNSVNTNLTALSSSLTLLKTTVNSIVVSNTSQDAKINSLNINYSSLNTRLTNLTSAVNSLTVKVNKCCPSGSVVAPTGSTPTGSTPTGSMPTGSVPTGSTSGSGGGGVTIPPPPPPPPPTTAVDTVSLLTNFSIGMNLGEGSYYTPQWLFKNAWHQSSGWQSWGALMPSYNGGRRKLSWDGAASINIEGVTTVHSRTPNSVEYEAGQDQQLLLKLVSGTPTNIVDVSLTTPNADLVWNDAYLSSLRPFHNVLRTMQWQRINDQADTTNWTDRTLPSDTRKISRWGFVWEDMIDLANKMGSHLWICIPTRATDDYVRNVAKLIKTLLKPELKCFVEYSNEVWNGSFSQYQYAIQQGKARGMTGSDWDISGLYQAARSKEIFQIFRSENVSSMIRVIGSFAVSAYRTELLLKAFAGDYDCVAIAPYFAHIYGPGYDISKLTADVDNMLGEVTKQKDMCKKWNVPLIAYEGGPHIVPGDTATISSYTTIHNSAEMEAAYKRFLKGWIDRGCGLYVHYVDLYKPSSYGVWGAADSQTRLNTAKRRALQAAVDGTL